MRIFYLLTTLFVFTCALNAQVLSYEGLFMGSASFDFEFVGGDTIGTISNFKDQTSLGFRLTDIDTSEVLLPSGGSMWKVDSVLSKTVIEARVRVKRISTYGAKPVGNGYVGRPSPHCKLLANPFTLSKSQQATLDSYNKRTIEACAQVEIPVEQFERANANGAYFISSFDLSDLEGLTSPEVNAKLEVLRGGVRIYYPLHYTIRGDTIRAEILDFDDEIISITKKD